MQEMQQLIQNVRELAKRLESMAGKEVQISEDARVNLASLFVQLARILNLSIGSYVAFDEGVGLETRRLALLYAVPPSRGAEVSILKCREKGCDKGLQLKIEGDRLRLRCETHGDWDIGPATKV